MQTLEQHVLELNTSIDMNIIIPCRYTQLFLSACKITLPSNPRYTIISFLHLLFKLNNGPVLIVHNQLYPNIVNTQTYSCYNLTQPSLSTQQECTLESISIPILHMQHCPILFPHTSRRPATTFPSS